MTVDPIKIQGLTTFQRALREMDNGAQKQLRLVFNRAADLIVSDASAKVPRKTGAAARSIKARSGQREAVVVGGGNRAQHLPWLDFGGRTGRNRSVERKFIKGGRYIYPALGENRAKIESLLEDGLRELVTSAGLDVE